MAMTFVEASSIVRKLRTDIANNLDNSLNPIDEKLDQDLQDKLGKAKRRMLRLKNK